MVDHTYFFDSYAILAIIQDNPAYAHYKQCKMATTALNLIEVNYILLRDYGMRIVDAFYHALIPTLVEYEHVIQEANVMRLQMKKRNVSAADCVGYTLAKLAGIKFLTGDKEFENLPNVEFIK